MSYKRITRSDSINELLANLVQFHNMRHHLLTDDFDAFIRWFDKLRMVDPRTTWIYLNMNRDKLSPDQIEYVESIYNRRME